uniref:Orf455 n=1 Tax=Hyaloraphidium curvatum TaxID=82268 RepID=Q950T9_HYACU|nr:orf455 [Hyaloraphidium curvatum]AAK83427.1 orf455 [Hyaloraphidium curvatum]
MILLLMLLMAMKPVLIPYLVTSWLILLLLLVDFVTGVIAFYKLGWVIRTSLAAYYTLALATSLSTGLPLLIAMTIPFFFGALWFWSMCDLGKEHWLSKLLAFMAIMFAVPSLWDLFKEYFGLRGFTFFPYVHAEGRSSNSSTSESSSTTTSDSEDDPGTSSESEETNARGTVGQPFTPLRRPRSAPPWDGIPDQDPVTTKGSWEGPVTQHEFDAARDQYKKGLLSQLTKEDRDLLSSKTLQVKTGFGERLPKKDLDPPLPSSEFRSPDFGEDLYKSAGLKEVNAMKPHDPSYISRGHPSVLWYTPHAGVGQDRTDEFTLKKALKANKDLIKATFRDQLLPDPLSQGARRSVSDLSSPAQIYIRFGLIMEQLYLMGRAGMSPLEQLEILQDLLDLLSQIDRQLELPSSSSDPHLDRLIQLRRQVQRLYYFCRVWNLKFFDFSSFLPKRNKDDHEDK